MPVRCYEKNVDIQVRFRWTPATSALLDNRVTIHNTSWDYEETEPRHCTTGTYLMNLLMRRREGSKRRDCGAAAILAPLPSGAAAAVPFAFINTQHRNSTFLPAINLHLISLGLPFLPVYLGLNLGAMLRSLSALVEASSTMYWRRSLNSCQHSSSSRHCKLAGCRPNLHDDP
jgi:hypothetical protein